MTRLATAIPGLLAGASARAQPAATGTDAQSIARNGLRTTAQSHGGLAPLASSRAASPGGMVTPPPRPQAAFAGFKMSPPASPRMQQGQRAQTDNARPQQAGRTQSAQRAGASVPGTAPAMSAASHARNAAWRGRQAAAHFIGGIDHTRHALRMNQVANGFRATARAAWTMGARVGVAAQESGRTARESFWEGYRETRGAYRQRQADAPPRNARDDGAPPSVPPAAAASARAAALPDVGAPITMRAGFTPVDMTTERSIQDWMPVIADMRANGLKDEHLAGLLEDMKSARGRESSTALSEAYDRKYAALFNGSFFENAGQIARLSVALDKVAKSPD